MVESTSPGWRLSPGLRWRAWDEAAAVAFVPAAASTLLLDSAACALLRSADAQGQLPAAALQSAGEARLHALAQAGLLSAV